MIISTLFWAGFQMYTLGLPYYLYVYILYVIEWYVFEWFLGIVQLVQNPALIFGWTLAEVTPETLYTSAKIVYIINVFEWYVFVWFLGILQMVQNPALTWGRGGGL